VTARSITLGQIATISGPVPGLGSSAQAAVQAHVAYRNAVGGVCGRQIELVTADDGNDNGRFRSILTEMEPRVLGIAGIFAGADAGGADVAEATGIPILGAASSTLMQQAPTMFDIDPPPANPAPFIGKFRHLFDQGVRTAAVVTLAAAPAVEELDQQQSLIEAAGIEVVSRQILPVTTLSFDSAARAVANSKAHYLFFLAASDHDAAMARAMRDTGYTPMFEEYLTGYGSNYVDLAGAAAEGTTSWIRTLPAEDGGANPEQAAFQEWMASTAPDAPADVFASDAWAATKLFLDSLEELTGPISRQALSAHVGSLTAYDAGGFLGPIDLAAEVTNGCLIGMRVDGGAWRRLAPAEGFLC
jgi:ABC-type branched-subunit amino acid transport system substrate-binding protein